MKERSQVSRLIMLSTLYSVTAAPGTIFNGILGGPDVKSIYLLILRMITLITEYIWSYIERVGVNFYATSACA